jgi:hypothetical protein
MKIKNRHDEDENEHCSEKKMQLYHWSSIDVNELPMHLYRYDKWRDIVLVP